MNLSRSNAFPTWGRMRLPTRQLGTKTLFGDIPFARCAKDGDGGDGDGTAGGGKGGADKLTEAQEAGIVKIIDERFNKAIGPRLRKQLDAITKSMRSALREELTEAGVLDDDGKPVNPAKGKDDGKGGDGDGGDDKVPPAFRRRLEQAEKKLQESDKRQEALDARDFRTEVAGELSTIAKAKGIKDADDIQHFVDHFVAKVKRETDSEELVIGEKTMAEVTDGFFNSTQGKRLIPSNKGKGSGATDGDGSSGAGTGEDVSVRDALETLVHRGSEI